MGWNHQLVMDHTPLSYSMVLFPAKGWQKAPVPAAFCQPDISCWPSEVLPKKLINDPSKFLQTLILCMYICIYMYTVYINNGCGFCQESWWCFWGACRTVNRLAVFNFNVRSYSAGSAACSAEKNTVYMPILHTSVYIYILCVLISHIYMKYMSGMLFSKADASTNDKLLGWVSGLVMRRLSKSMFWYTTP